MRHISALCLRAAGALLVLVVIGPVVAAAPTPHDSDPDWISGHWCGGDERLRLEEHWLTGAGGQWLGVSRSIREDRVLEFEFLRIEPVDGVPTYLAQPGGRPHTAFARVDGGADWIRFENMSHDFPQRIEYRRTGNALSAEISGPGKDGTPRRIAFDFRRCPEQN